MQTSDFTPECKHGVRRGYDCGLCDLGNGFETDTPERPEQAREPVGRVCVRCGAPCCGRKAGVGGTWEVSACEHTSDTHRECGGAWIAAPAVLPASVVAPPALQGEERELVSKLRSLQNALLREERRADAEVVGHAVLALAARPAQSAGEARLREAHTADKLTELRECFGAPAALPSVPEALWGSPPGPGANTAGAPVDVLAAAQELARMNGETTWARLRGSTAWTYEMDARRVLHAAGIPGVLPADAPGTPAAPEDDGAPWAHDAGTRARIRAEAERNTEAYFRAPAVPERAACSRCRAVWRPLHSADAAKCPSCGAPAAPEPCDWCGRDDGTHEFTAACNVYGPPGAPAQAGEDAS